MKLTSHFQSPQMRSRYEDIEAGAILKKNGTQVVGIVLLIRDYENSDMECMLQVLSALHRATSIADSSRLVCDSYHVAK